MGIARLSVMLVAMASTAVATIACSPSSSGNEALPDLARCDEDGGDVVCISDVGSIASDAVAAVDAADGGEPGTMSAGACSGSVAEGGPWSICVIPVDGGQVVVGRDSDDGLLARAAIDEASVEFPLDNDRGEATVVHGRANRYEIVDDAGRIVGEIEGVALTTTG